MNTQSDFHISDLESFNAVTDDTRQVARLYIYSMVDRLIDLAYPKIFVRFFYETAHAIRTLGRHQLEKVSPGHSLLVSCRVACPLRQ